MPYAWCEFGLGRHIGSELVGHHHPRQTPSLEELAHEQLCGRGVAPLLNEDIQDVPVRVVCPPQLMLRAVDFEYDLVEMPLVGWAGPIASDLRGELRAKPRNPHPNRLMGNDDAPLGQNVFDISQAQGETVGRPDGISDFGSRKAVPLEAERSSRFSMRASYRPSMTPSTRQCPATGVGSPLLRRGRPAVQLIQRYADVSQSDALCRHDVLSQATSGRLPRRERAQASSRPLLYRTVPAFSGIINTDTSSESCAIPRSLSVFGYSGT